MNRLDGIELFDKLRKNEIYGNNTLLLAERRAILDEIDLVKTKVWWLLSKEFLKKDTSKEKKMLEIRAFYDYIANRFMLRDFNRPFDKIEEKADSIFYQSDWNILEYVIIEQLIRNSQWNDTFTFHKWASESDTKNKSDFITTYKQDWKKYKIGVQMTVLKDAKLLTSKMHQIKNISGRIDAWLNNERLVKEQLIDTLIFVDFFWFHATKKWTNLTQFGVAWKERRDNWYTWDILDYVKSERLRTETIAFCDIFPSVIDSIFKIINKNKWKIETVNWVINLDSWATGKYCS